MARVVVARTGSAWSLEGATSNYGEQGDTTGVAKMLMRMGHDVLCTGKIRGELQGATVVNWDFPPCTAYSDPDHVASCYEQVLRPIEAWKPDVWIDVVGPCPSVSWVGNPRGTITQDFAVRYVGPSLWVQHKLCIPRICCINDPRSYPRDHEIHFWPQVTPVAVLSQERRSFPRVMCGEKFMVHAVYAGLETYCLIDREPVFDGYRDEPVIIAHSHLHDSRVNKSRKEVWDYLLRDGWPYAIYGRGWEGHEPCKPHEVHEILQRSTCGPMIPVTHGFVTAKFAQYAWNGAVPLPYGTSKDTMLCYDVDEFRFPMDCELRHQGGEELWERINRAKLDADWRRDWCERIYASSQADGTLLDECVNHFANGGDIDYSTYGGYERI